MGLDVSTTLRTWTANQTLISVVAFFIVMLYYGIHALF